MVHKALLNSFRILLVLFTALYLQNICAFEESDNITLSSYGVLLNKEKNLLGLDGFSLMADDTLTELTPRRDGWLTFRLSLDEVDDSNIIIIFPDGLV